MRHDLTTSAEMRRYGNLDAPSANSVILHIWGPPRKRRQFAAAMAWLMKNIIEGFAAYGEIICPCYVDLPDSHTDRGQPDIAASRPQPAPRPSRGGLMLRLERWLAWLRRQPRPDHTEPALQRETLDDRTLRDIGMLPYQPDELDRYLERYMDHGGW